jgi:hypothetical protein
VIVRQPNPLVPPHAIRCAAALGALLALAAPAAACRPAAEVDPDSEPAPTAAAVGEVPGERSGPIVLRDRVIDTSAPPPEVDAALEARPTAAGQLALVQFSGPVRDRWLDEVAAQGPVDVVTYLPENAYLIWTDGLTLAKLRELVSESPYVQWVGEFHPAYKLAPSLQESAAAPASRGDVTVTVQLAAHEGVEASERAIVARSREVLRPAWTVGAYRNLRVVVPASDLTAIAALPDVVNVEPWLEPGLAQPGLSPPAAQPAGEPDGDRG